METSYDQSSSEVIIKSSENGCCQKQFRFLKPDGKISKELSVFSSMHWLFLNFNSKYQYLKHIDNMTFFFNNYQHYKS